MYIFIEDTKKSSQNLFLNLKTLKKAILKK